MELKQYLEEIDNGNNKILGDISRQIQELKINQYIASFHLLKKAINELHKEFKKENIYCMVTMNEEGSGYYFSSDFYKKNEDRTDEIVNPSNKKEKTKLIMSKMSEYFDNFLENLYPSTDKWVGEILDDSVIIDFSHPDCVKLEDWFLSDKLKSIYNKSILEKDLPEATNKTTKKIKL